MGTMSRGFGVRRDGVDRGVLSVDEEKELAALLEKRSVKRSILSRILSWWRKKSATDFKSHFVGNRHDRRRAASLLARNNRARRSWLERVGSGMIARRAT